MKTKNVNLWRTNPVSPEATAAPRALKDPGAFTTFRELTRIRTRRITELVNEIIATSPWWRVMDVTPPKPFWCRRILPPPANFISQTIEDFINLSKDG